MAAMTEIVVVGSAPDTPVVAQAVGLRHGRADGNSSVVVVLSGPDDIEVVRDAVASEGHTIAAVIAIRLEEHLVVAAYDLGLPVAFGYCSRAELDTAMARGSAPPERRTAAALASIEQVLAGRTEL
jgi:hypothetical protein